jgi:hypothetical protein
MSVSANGARIDTRRPITAHGSRHQLVAGTTTGGNGLVFSVCQTTSAWRRFMSFLKKVIKITVIDLILMNILLTVAIISTGHVVSYLIGYVPLALGGN